jgi:thiol-disulfide isomerase/thioredoxin
MKKLAITLPLLLLLVGCSAQSPSLKGEVISCSEIETLPGISSNQSLECLDGSTGLPVDSIKGPAIINVWGSWCDPCRDEIPYFRDFYAQMDPSIQLIGVDVEERNREDGQKFVRDYGITWPNLYDEDGSTRKYFGMGVPVTWFIGPDGETIYKHIGPIKSLTELKNLSSKHLGVS